jgi:chromosomal replication initiation ATPase DnaA
MEREIIDYLKFIPFTLEQLRSKSRKRELVYHRFTAMYLLRKKRLFIDAY